jgi:hypothetical protein
LEAVIVPLKVQYKSTLPLTNPKAVVNQKYKADAQSTGFLPIFSDDKQSIQYPQNVKLPEIMGLKPRPSLDGFSSFSLSIHSSMD